MSEWKDYYLGDVVDYKKGFAFKSNWYQRQGRYIVRVSDTTLNSINIASCNCISEELASQFEIYSLLKDDVIIATVGSWPNNPSSVVGKVVKVPNEANGALLNQNAVRLRGNEKIDNKFLYYLLKSNQFSRYIVSKAQGSANQASITLKDIIHYSFKAPELEEQSLIANFLYALDDKIAVNRRICENLEAQAQALFKHWFIDFAPFKNGKFVESELGMIPEGWRVCKLGSFFPIKTGKKDANIATATGQYPFFSCSQNVLTTNVFSFDGSAILVAGNGDFNVKWYEGKFEAYQRTYVLMPYESSYTHFLFYAIQYNLREITCGAGGTVIKFIRKADLENFKIAIPQELDKCDVLSVFSEINKNIANISTESNSLSTLRDTLLPKLMSGQIKV